MPLLQDVSRYVAANANPNIADAHRLFTHAKIVVPLKYLSNAFRLLEMLFIICEIHLDLTWTKTCVMSTIVGATTFQITNTKLCVPVVTLSTKDNVNLTKQLNEGLKRSAYWSEYISKIGTKHLNNNNLTRFLLDASFQGVNRLFVLAFDNILILMVLTNFKETVIGSIFLQECHQL